jgi:chromosome segregation ATPase
MTVSTFFEKLLGQQRQKTQVNLAGYRELVSGIATGAEPDHAEVERLLDTTGKSLDDLRRDMERFQHRMELKARVASLPDLDREFAKVQQQIAAAEQLLTDAERRHDETTGPLYSRLREIKDAQSDASRATQELFHTCDDPDLKRQLNQVTSEINRLLKANKDLATHATLLDNKADSQRDQADKELSEADRDHRREQSVLYRKQAESLRRQIKTNEKAQADALKQREQIEDRMRQW